MSEIKDKIKARALEALNGDKSSAENAATKKQVEARMKDLRKQFERAQDALHAKQRQEVKRLAERFVAEMKKEAELNGFEYTGFATSITVGGGHRTWGISTQGRVKEK